MTRIDWYKPNTNGGFCHCGCGQRTALAKRRGQPLRYVRGHVAAHLGMPTNLIDLTGQQFGVQNWRTPRGGARAVA